MRGPARLVWGINALPQKREISQENARGGRAGFFLLDRPSRTRKRKSRPPAVPGPSCARGGNDIFTGTECSLGLTPLFESTLFNLKPAGCRRRLGECPSPTPGSHTPCRSPGPRPSVRPDAPSFLRPLGVGGQGSESSRLFSTGPGHTATATPSEKRPSPTTRESTPQVLPSPLLGVGLGRGGRRRRPKEQHGLDGAPPPVPAATAEAAAPVRKAGKAAVGGGAGTPGSPRLGGHRERPEPTHCPECPIPARRPAMPSRGPHACELTAWTATPRFPGRGRSRAAGAGLERAALCFRCF